LANRKIFSFVNTLAQLLSLLRARQRGIDTDQRHNWVYKDNDGDFHVTANQRTYSGSSWSFSENDFGETTFHDLPIVETNSNFACFDSNGKLNWVSAEDALADIVNAEHVHDSIESSGQTLTVLSSGLVELPGGLVAIKGILNGFELYNRSGESWVLATRIDL
jgi:hypothetical protein